MYRTGKANHMLDSIKARLGRDDEQGFTLIELMVVVLIIAILLAIAIPTFLGAKNTANSRAAQSSLRNALTAEQTYWTNNQSFTATASQIQTIEPNLNWLSAAPTTPDANSIFPAMDSTGNLLFLQALGKDGKCYTVFQNNSPGATGYTTGYNVNTSCPSLASPAAVTISQGSAAAHVGTSYYNAW